MQSDSAATEQEYAATVFASVEYGTERPCKVGRLTYRLGVHDYVALTCAYTDDDSPWYLTWVGEKRRDTTRMPDGIFPSPAMLAALATAPVEDESDG